jgi:hypothetical protein
VSDIELGDDGRRFHLHPLFFLESLVPPGVDELAERTSTPN